MRQITQRKSKISKKSEKEKFILATKKHFFYITALLEEIAQRPLRERLEDFRYKCWLIRLEKRIKFKGTILPSEVNKLRCRYIRDVCTAKKKL